jgi:hypothetical protein
VFTLACRCIRVFLQLPAFSNVNESFKSVIFARNPLHVPGRVLAASAERLYVIDLEAGAGAAVLGGGGAGVLGPERTDLRSIALDRLG